MAFRLELLSGQPRAQRVIEAVAAMAEWDRERDGRALGETPMEYLARWRILLAADKLENTSDSIAMIAIALGYE